MHDDAPTMLARPPVPSQAPRRPSLRRGLTAFLLVVGVALVVASCARYMPFREGMSAIEAVDVAGEPDARWEGEGADVWLYRLEGPFGKRGGTWCLILVDSTIQRVTPRRTDFGLLVLGMSEDAVTGLLGHPTRVAAQGNVKYLTYYLSSRREGPQAHYARFVDGLLESYGRVGDFDSTKEDSATLNLNITQKEG